MMSKFGDDLIQSLKEALSHARGNGAVTEHASESPCGSDAGDVQAGTDGAADDAD